MRLDLPLRPVTVASLLVLAGLPAAAGATPSPTPCLERPAPERAACLAAAVREASASLSWIAPDGEVAWTLALDAPRPDALARWPAQVRETAGPALADAVARMLGGLPPGPDAPVAGSMHARDWRPELPDLEVALYGGGTMDLAGLRGQVVVLEFWATWCPPCKETLPRLQSLYDAHADQGLIALAIGHEPAEIALPYAEELGLELPLGRYRNDMDDAFHVGVLPTVIVADRGGRLRARWDGRDRGASQDAEIERVVLDLLAEDDRGHRVDLAEAFAGGDGLYAVWSRRFPGRVEGLGALPFAAGDPRELLVIAGALYRMKADGHADDRIEGSPLAGRVRIADLDGDGVSRGWSFRRGSETVVALGLDGEHRVLRSPSPVLDLAPRPAEGTGELWLATLDGVHRLAPDGSALGQVAATAGGEVTGIAPDPTGPGFWLLLPDGRLCRVEEAAGGPTCHEIPPDGWLLAADSRFEGMAIAPTAVSDVALGRLGADRPRLAVATVDERLLLVDPRDGRVTFHARWPRLRGLALSDLDGDGADELYVASGRRVSLVRPGAAGP